MKNILFLVGSPKIKKSTSEAIIDYIIEGINVKNIDTEIEKINILSAIEKEPLKLIDAVNKADTIVLSFPTYIDTLPTHVIRALLLIDEYADKYKERNFMAIANCGFPEPLHNDNVMKIYKNYCN